MPVNYSPLPVDRSYVLLTGGTGLVGQYLVKELLSAGERVALVVRVRFVRFPLVLLFVFVFVCVLFSL